MKGVARSLDATHPSSKAHNPATGAHTAFAEKHWPIEDSNAVVAKSWKSSKRSRRLARLAYDVSAPIQQNVVTLRCMFDKTVTCR